jgi:hypothetical protein
MKSKQTVRSDYVGKFKVGRCCGEPLAFCGKSTKTRLLTLIFMGNQSELKAIYSGNIYNHRRAQI